MIVRADARHIPLADESVQCVVTSPPYWGLRDYGTARWEGGDTDCDHDQRRQPEDGKQATNQGASRDRIEGGSCRWCGARRIDAQIGLEPTPEAYVATMVQVFREVKRILRDDGTLWLNLGDSYTHDRFSSKFGEASHFQGDDGLYMRKVEYMEGQSLGAAPKRSGGVWNLKTKDLVGMPWRIAFALQADAWYLRSDIIWAKPNPMPESVTDRPTRSHEYLFLLSKSERYFYDADAIREPHSEPWRSGTSENRMMAKGTDGSTAMHGGWEYDQRIYNPAGRNKRDVWTINSEPTPEAHFATFPQKLVEPCILAGSRTGDLCFDPFLGSGTVGKVCERLGRRWAGLELSAEYIAIARQRTAQTGLQFGAAK